MGEERAEGESEFCTVLLLLEFEQRLRHYSWGVYMCKSLLKVRYELDFGRCVCAPIFALLYRFISMMLPNLTVNLTTQPPTHLLTKLLFVRGDLRADERTAADEAVFSLVIIEVVRGQS